jgi:hypothetical protein
MLARFIPVHLREGINPGTRAAGVLANAPPDRRHRTECDRAAITDRAIVLSNAIMWLSGRPCADLQRPPDEQKSYPRFDQLVGIPVNSKPRGAP